jgi:hypothetical protein
MRFVKILKRSKAVLLSSSTGRQGCQIFQCTQRGKIYQISIKHTEWPQNIPNDRKIHRPMAIKYTNILDWRTIQNLPKFRFLVRKYAIWQPCRPLFSLQAFVSTDYVIISGRAVQVARSKWCISACTRLDARKSNLRRENNNGQRLRGRPSGVRAVLKIGKSWHFVWQNHMPEFTALTPGLGDSYGSTGIKNTRTCSQFLTTLVGPQGVRFP